jgi:copper chaperone CopZ
MKDNCHVDPIQKNASSEEREPVCSALLSVWGMGCPNCAMRIHNGLVKLEGVVDAYVDHHAGIAQVAFNPKMIAVSALVDAVAGAGNDGRHGYQAVLMALRDRDDGGAREQQDLWWAKAEQQ